MDIRDIEHGLDILIRYNESIRQKLLGLDRELCCYPRQPWKTRIEEVTNLSNEIVSNINSFLEILALEEDIERLIKKVDRKLHQSLRHDIKMIEHILLELKEHLESILESKEFLSANNLTEIKRFTTDSEEILSKDIYIEILMEEIMDHIKTEWDRNIKDKSDWLYHGTSILFLPYIREHGLHPSKLPKGVARGIKTISQIFAKYGLTWAQGQLDIDTDMAQKGTCLSWQSNIRTAAAAVNLPAFLYELFNEENIRSHPQVVEVLSQLNEEENRMCKVIWRFGRILRKKNKVVVLQIKVNSEFIKYLDLPDYIGDYSKFFSEYICKFMRFNELMQNTNARKATISYLCADIKEPFKKLYGVGPVEVRIKQLIPQEFIFLDIKGAVGYNLINISQWNEDMEPRII